MSLHDHLDLRALSQKIFVAAGVDRDDAKVIADMLVDAELMGLSSHGLQRIIQYAKDMKTGAIVPHAEILINRHTATTAVVDGQWNFGQLVAKRATEEIISIAHTHGMGAAVVRNCRHIGRLGAYAELCVANGCIGLVMASAGNEGHWVAPFGGREGRLATNPLAFAAPTTGDPVVMDFSTSISPEGKIRLLRDSEQQLDSPMIIDKQGKPSSNPHDLYHDDGSRAGAILPLGGDQGYKGFGLSLMVQIMGSLLGTPIWNCDGRESLTNGTWLAAISIDAFMDPDAFQQETHSMLDYIRSSEPVDGGTGVMIPGQREFEMMRQRTAHGVPIDDNIWNLLMETAQALGVES